MNDLNVDYYSYDETGKYCHILPMDACINSLRERLIDQAGIIESQKKMISEYDQKNSENETIMKLQKQVSSLQKRLAKSFEISDLNLGKINKWQEKHDKKHLAYPTGGERYLYEFLPSGIVTCVTCSCMLCHEKINFYEE